MTAPGPTHSGSPFVGRSREIGILAHLLEEGLEGRLGLIRVAGTTGSGRRRLIAEALNRGPDAEWIHLAPGGVEADLRRWARTELIDLLDSYPDAPVPSWAMHVLEPWVPSLAYRSAVPSLSRETIPDRDAPEVLGRAIGALLLALTGRTSVIVDAGLWPKRGVLVRTLSALIDSLREPGAVVIAAAESEGLATDPRGERTLLLEPLDRDAVALLTERWNVQKGRDAFAAWLTRATLGHPFFLQEAVRWLEELGHVRVHEEERRIELLSTTDRWPFPLHLGAVLETRYRRLSPVAAQLLHSIAREDGQLDLETLRLRWDDDESFEEGMSWLRRRDFLRERSTRRPLALASPLWRGIARTNLLRLPQAKGALVPGPTSEAPLARVLARIEELIETPAALSVDERRREIAELARRIRGRRGPAWDGVRGRLAVLAARGREEEGRPDRALQWARWGLAHTSPDIHPGLRRSLRAQGALCLERGGAPREAARWRRDAFEEAWAAGHLIAASRLDVVLAEEARRFGAPVVDGKALDQDLREKGLVSRIPLALFTEISALLDAREFDAARAALESLEMKPAGLAPRLERLTSTALTRVPEPAVIPRGWKWGLDEGSSWLGALGRIETAERNDDTLTDSILAGEQLLAEERGFLPLALDVAETRLFRRARSERTVEVSGKRTAKSTAPADAGLGDLLGQVARLLEGLNMPSRGRDLAERLRETEAGEHRLFPALFSPHLLYGVGAPPPASSPSFQVFLTGVPRICHGGRTWPKALWPEWWTELWGSALSAALCGEALDPTAIEERWRSSGSLPALQLPEWLAQANELFRGPERSAGGLEVQSGTLVVVWTGFWCDARAALLKIEAADAEKDPVRARALYGEGLDAVRGPYLSGLDSPQVERARAMLHQAVSRALEKCLEADRVPAHRLARWLEGPVRCVGGSEVVAQFMERGGRPRAALALRHGSP